MKFSTKRLELRPIDINDRNSIFEYRSDYETNKYQGWIPENLDDVDKFIEKISSIANQSGSWFQFVIIEKGKKKIIGDIGILFLNVDNQQVEIGCTLHRDYQSKGYATEALKRVIDYLFDDLNKHRITASIDPENSNSIKLMERLGFRKEAHFIESLYLNEKWVDDMVFSLLKREWKCL